MIHTAEKKEEFWLCVEAGSDSVESGSEVLTKSCGVWARTALLDFRGQREKAVFAVGDDAHHSVGKPALENLDERVNLADAEVFYSSPSRLAERLDSDVDVIEIASRDDR